MRFVQFSGNRGSPQRLGVQLTQDGDIIDISGVDSSIPNSLVQLLYAGPEMLEKSKRVVAEGKSLIPLSDVRLLPPVSSPDKIVCVGLNYRGHCEEQNRPIPQEPLFFSKWSSCIVGPNAEIKHPSITNELDWEVELAVIIGKRARDVRPTDAMDHVFGFTVAQDITARDWQKKKNGGQWLLGKSMDGSCPLGPSVVLKEVVADPHALPIRCKVNGKVKQDGNTNELIHKIDYLVSYLSHCCTLLPGDVLLTGTPAGVGVFRNPQEFLKPGDVIESEIEGIGVLKNTIV
jgi:2-keto-4-pentenoate hydratase/2-oxohepta-3-ene-1,7-dioic acid hydratase in catechol pathway